MRNVDTHSLNETRPHSHVNRQYKALMHAVDSHEITGHLLALALRLLVYRHLMYEVRGEAVSDNGMRLYAWALARRLVGLGDDIGEARRLISANAVAYGGVQVRLFDLGISADR